MSDCRVRVGYVSDDTANIKVACLTNVAPEASCSGGSVAVSALDERIASKLYTSSVTITGLSADTGYTFSVSQDGTTRSGSFKTLPADQTTDFSFIVSSCDTSALRYPSTPYTYMRSLVAAADPPVLFRVHPDDLTYVDSYEVDDATTALTSSGAPQDTGVIDDFDMAWAAQIGLLPTEGKWRGEDRQWINENLPLVASGGDHMIEGNHCRGSTLDPNYQGCNRLPGDAVPNLEPNAIDSWNAFVGDVNPPNLAGDARTASMTWGFEAGPCRFVMADSSMNSVPYDEVDTTQDHFGATQLANIRTYLNVSTVPFKFMFLETGYNKSGQPWANWWKTEADAWETQLAADDNLNGTDGHFVGMYGDSHAQQTFSFTNFWAFGAGMIDSNCVFSQGQPTTWGGKQRFWHGANTDGEYGATATDSATGLRPLFGFMHVIVRASRSPKQIEVRHIDGRDGGILQRYTMDFGTANNQFSNPVTPKLS